MSEKIPNQYDMVVVMSKGNELLVPPHLPPLSFGLARTGITLYGNSQERSAFRGDEIETAALRLGREYGREPKIRKPLIVPPLEDAPTHAYLLQNDRYLHGSEFTVHYTEIEDRLLGVSHLSEVEMALLINAAKLIELENKR